MNNYPVICDRCTIEFDGTEEQADSLNEVLCANCLLDAGTEGEVPIVDEDGL